jgi:hypothetical protein
MMMVKKLQQQLDQLQPSRKSVKSNPLLHRREMRVKRALVEEKIKRIR